MPLIDSRGLEAATQRIGRELFDRVEAESPSRLSMEYAQQAAMAWLTRDDDLRLRVFRFIEVLPSLRDAPAIARHLEEYLHRDGHGSHSLPLPMQIALAYRRNTSLHAALVAAMVRTACIQMARRFICGSTLPEALSSVLRMRRQGMTFTLDVLGETVIADRLARENQQIYLNLVHEIGRAGPSWSPAPILDEAPFGPLPRVNVSIKLSAIVAKFDPIDSGGVIRNVLDRLRPIFRAARQHGVFINLDMEHYAVKDMTLEIFRRALSEPEFADWPHCGIVIQTYLKDAEHDMRALIDWVRRRGTPITVRLVKGAYWDYETIQSLLNERTAPVFARKWQSDASFENVARIMLEHTDLIRPAFASHNVRSIASVLAAEQARGLPPRTVEFQMLTGMGEPLKRAVVGMGQRLRIYAPFGDLIRGMAYLIRRLIENTSNDSFLRQISTERSPANVLLADPRSHADQPQGPELYRPSIQDPDEIVEMNPFSNESDVDFSRPENVRAMEAALAATRRQFGAEHAAIIGGLDVRPGQSFETRNPSHSGEVVGRCALCAPGIVDRAVSAAKNALADWSATPTQQRADVLDRAADLLRERRFEAAAWQAHEVGKPWREAHGDVLEALDYLRYYAYEMRRLSNRPRRRDFPGESNQYLYGPRGVVAVISPFCFPLALSTGMAAAALAAGNTVVFKPARAASVCGHWLARLLIEAGLPAGVLNLVTGPGDVVGERLATHPDVDMIAFTGTSAVGSRIIEHARTARPAGRGFRHVVADMGGKNAMIVDADADLDEAVQSVVASWLGYAGQKCTTCSRVIVLTSVYNEFLAKMVEAAGAVRPGAAELPATTVGPLIDADAVERARRFIEIGKSEARCVLEPAPGKSSDGHFIGPAIFADVPANARIAQEEVLAPILAVIRASDFNEAINFANATPYALTGGLHSRSPRNIEAAKRRLRAGTLYINRRITASRVDRQPFGGTGLSGLGTKTGGPDYLKEFMLARTISENTMRHGFAPAAGDTHEETGTRLEVGTAAHA